MPRKSTSRSATKGSAKKQASRKKSSARAAAPLEFASAIRSTGTVPWYAVLLRDRGQNVNTVNMIEQAAGGDPSRPTPYQVAAYPVRPPADFLEHQLDLAGATSDVQQV